MNKTEIDEMNKKILEAGGVPYKVDKYTIEDLNKEADNYRKSFKRINIPEEHASLTVLRSKVVDQENRLRELEQYLTK